MKLTLKKILKIRKTLVEAEKRRPKIWIGNKEYVLLNREGRMIMKIITVIAIVAIMFMVGCERDEDLDIGWADRSDHPVVIPNDPPPVVPTPSALILGMIGVGVVSWLKRRRSL